KLVGLVDLIFEALVGLGVLKVAADVVGSLGDLVPEFQVDGPGSILGEFVGQHPAKSIGRVVVGGEADDGELIGKKFVLREIAARGDELAFGEVAGGANNNHH